LPCAFNAAWPGRAKLLQTDAATHTAKDENYDDGIIGVPENGNEVWDHIDRYGQVDEQQGDSDADPSRKVAISSESSQQSEQVRKKA
jgi:hypothetical protein